MTSIPWRSILTCTFILCVSLASVSSAADKFRVYVGTYTGEKSKGIYLLELDAARGTLSNKTLAAEVASPSFLAVHPSNKYLYCVNEVSEVDGKKTGAVSAFAIDAKSGKLTLLNHESSQGAGPCHLVVDKAGKNVLVANYGGGSVASLPIREDGKVGPATSAIQHKGASVNPDRQKEPHAHSINLDAANRFAFAADLGLDKVLIYKFNPEKGTLLPHEPEGTTVAGGSGPRHFAFHPGGKFAYVINEMANTVTAFKYDADKGTLTETQTIGTLPKGFDGKSYTAEIVVHPSGKFVYGSNRGHNSLAIFAVDAETGKLAEVGHQSTGGKTPRNFAIDPTGANLLAENQDSGTIVVFKIDAKTGKLMMAGTNTGDGYDVPSPVCVRFVPIE